MVWVHDADRGTLRPQRPEATAHEADLHTVIGPGGQKDDRIEEMIGGIEAKGMPVLRRLVAREQPTPQERADFASFVALMHVRTRPFRHGWAAARVHMLQARLRALAGSDAAMARFRADMAREGGHPVSDADVAALRAVLPVMGERMTAEVGREWALRALSVHDALAPALFDMDWTVLTAPEGNVFATSDNPVVFFDPRPGPRLHGLRARGVRLTFPLASSVCLLADWSAGGRARLRFGRAHPAFVRFANEVRVAWADRMAFSSAPDERLLAALRARPSGRPPVEFVVTSLTDRERMTVQVKRGGT